MVAPESGLTRKYCGLVFETATGSLDYECIYCSQEFNNGMEFEVHVRSHIGCESKVDINAEPVISDNRLFNCVVRIERVDLPIIKNEVKMEASVDVEEANLSDVESGTLNDDISVKDDISIEEDKEDAPEPTVHLTVRALDAPESVEQSVKCECCYKTFACNGLRDMHVHPSPKPFAKCNLCPTYFPDRNSRLRHKQIHQMSRVYDCPHCGRVCETHQALDDHINVNKKQDVLPTAMKRFRRGGFLERKLECDICGRKFSSKTKISIHMKQHIQNKLRCDVCKKMFTSSCNLKRHMLVHTKEKPHACPICKKRFQHEPYVRIHMRMHTGMDMRSSPRKLWLVNLQLFPHILIFSGEKPYVCSRCGKSFVCHSYLTNHIKNIHEDIRNYKCDICDQRFRQPYLLADHMRGKHTKERPHACATCGRTFSSRKTMLQHELLHAEKKYNCNYCDKVFAQTAGRRCHEREVHQIP